MPILARKVHVRAYETPNARYGAFRSLRKAHSGKQDQNGKYTVRNNEQSSDQQERAGNPGRIMDGACIISYNFSEEERLRGNESPGKDPGSQRETGRDGVDVACGEAGARLPGDGGAGRDPGGPYSRPGRRAGGPAKDLVTGGGGVASSGA